MTLHVGADGEMEGDAFATEGAAVEFGGGIVADTAYVMRAKSPLAASDHGGGDLSAEEDLRVQNFGFMAGSREARKLVNVVGGIFADAKDVEFSRGTHAVVVQGKRRSENCKAGRRGLLGHCDQEGDAARGRGEKSARPQLKWKMKWRGDGRKLKSDRSRAFKLRLKCCWGVDVVMILLGDFA